MNEAIFPAEGLSPWRAGFRRACQAIIFVCAAFCVELRAAWVEGRWEPAWIPEHTESVWVDGRWEDYWVDGYWDNQWVDGYWDNQWVDGYWDNQWVDGYWDNQWVDGYWEDRWVDGYSEDQWVDGNWEERWVDGYWDENGNWNDGYWEWVWNDGYWHTVWHDGHWESAWNDGYWNNSWVDGYWNNTWVDGYWNNTWVDGYWTNTWVAGHWASRWIEAHWETVTVPGYWEPHGTWIPGHWNPPLEQTWVAFDDITSGWYQSAGWSPDPSTVPGGQSFTQTRTLARDHRTGERNDASEERNVSTYQETTNETRTATGTGAPPKQNQPPVSSAAGAITLGQSFTPSISGGAGTGAQQAVYGGYTNWGDGNTFSPPQSGSYSFWVRQLGDSQYNESNIAGPYTLTVTSGGTPPAITSALNASATVGTAFSYTVAASNSPTSYSASGLPGGLAVSAGTGGISGTPSQSGSFSVGLSATNAAGTGTATLTLTVHPAGGVNSTPTATFANQIVYNQGLLEVKPSMLNAVFRDPVTSAVLSGTVTYSAVRVNTGETINPFAPQDVPMGQPGYFAMTAFYGRLLVTARYHANATYNEKTITATFENVDNLGPTIPGNFRRVVIGPTSFSVAWEPSVDASGGPPEFVTYQVTLNGGAPVAVPSGITHTFTGVAADMQHTVQVRAKDYFGNLSDPATVTVATPAIGTDPTHARRWFDVNGDGLPDEVVGGDSGVFYYYAAQTQATTVTSVNWTTEYWSFPLTLGDGLFGFNWWWVPIPDIEYDVYTINSVRPKFIFTTDPNYEYTIVRVLSPTQYVRLFPPSSTLSGEWSPANFWPEDAYNALPFALARIALPPSGVQVNLPVIGNVTLRAGTGGVTGTVVLPGNIQIIAGSGSASITAPGAGTLSVNSGGVVTGSIGGLPGGYVLTGSSNGQITLTGPGGASLSSTPGGGTTLTLPGGTALTVSGSGAISLAVPGGTGALVQNALDELGRLLGLDLGTGNVRGQVLPPGGQPTQGAWGDIRNILLGNRPPGVYDIATTTDTRGVPESPTPPAAANIIRIRLTVQSTPPTVDLAIWNGGSDLDNGEQTGAQGALVAENDEETVGAFLLVNWDDDNSTGGTVVPDLTENTVFGEDNLALLKPTISPLPNTGTVEIEASGADADKIKLWTSATKFIEIPLTSGKKSWDLSDSTHRSDLQNRMTNGLWIEGIAPGTAKRAVSFALRYKEGGQTKGEDRVNATVVFMRLGSAVYRNLAAGFGDIPLIGHAAILYRFRDGIALTESTIENASSYDVAQSMGQANGPVFQSYTDITNNSDGAAHWPGCYEPSSLSYAGRLQILRAASELVALGPQGTRAIRYPSPTWNPPGVIKTTSGGTHTWNGTFGDIEWLRCDALVEVCLERPGAYVSDVWGKQVSGVWSSAINIYAALHNDQDYLTNYSDNFTPATQSGHTVPTNNTRTLFQHRSFVAEPAMRQ